MNKSVVCGLGGAAAFLAAFFLLRMRFGYAAVVGFGVWLALNLILAAESGVQRLPEVQGMTPEQVRRIIQEGEEKVKQLRGLRRKVRGKRVAERIEAIADVADRIFEDLREDPKDIKAARRFLAYYMDATLLVVRRYVDLSARGSTSEDAQQVLAKFEGLLDTIHATFEKQLNRLLRDDVLDLDADITVLKQMMEMEGL